MLCHMGHVISENRNGLVMSVTVTAATGHAESEAALAMVDELRSCLIISRTISADRDHDCGAHLEDFEQRGIEPHVALRPGRVGSAKGTSERNSARRASVLPRRRMECRTRSDGYRLGQRARKKVEEVFAWCKTVAGLGRAHHLGRWKILRQMQMAAAGYNLVRMGSLAVGCAGPRWEGAAAVRRKRRPNNHHAIPGCPRRFTKAFCIILPALYRPI
jgi:hypothetical protein